MDFQSALEFENENFDFSTSEDLAKVCQIIHEKTILSCLKPDMWQDYHDDIIFRYLVDASQHLLVFYINKDGKLCADTTMPTYYVEELCYFLKANDFERITYENLPRSLQYGTIKSDCLNNLLKQISKIYTPILFSNKTWPSYVKNDFSFQLHKFLANLTDCSYQLIRKKVLYIPEEGQDVSVEDAVNDKELVQRLEGVVLLWVRQIKEILGTQNVASQVETIGPLEEIQFWKQRCEDLSSISEQLQRSAVHHISSILEASKSPCLNEFIMLSHEIQANI
ncbi:dynein axonemal heavy chain 2 isoform X1 [Centruroides vittatus]|uniref:dynein axonemal heavy chain 2 isoform X1 n=2 Tax=Centruroides vittatus TaxID=120091 RepID=UPI00350FE173